MDTVARLLEAVPAEELDTVFTDWMVEHRYQLAIDGTQKWHHDISWDPKAIHRKTGPDSQSYLIYVVEAVLVGPAGIAVPFLAEFCENAEDADPETKQDSELKAFYRLAAHLHALFPKTRFCLLMDGLYPNGPLFALCRRYRWDFLIVLKDGNLPTLQDEAQKLHRLVPENRMQQRWGDRSQQFWWVNDLGYEWRDPETFQRRTMTVHYVVCHETWTDAQRDHATTWVWVSARPLTRANVATRCNRMARHRWDIEEHILVEKHHGYHYTHLFAKNWNGMKNWHTLMRLGHLLNILVLHSVTLWDTVLRYGIQGAIQWLRDTFMGNWLHPEPFQTLRERRHQLRLVW